MKLRFGAMSPKLYEQLNVEPQKVENEQKDLDAINRLRIRGLLTRQEVQRAEMRLIKRLSGFFA